MGIEAPEGRVEALLKELDGKDISEVVAGGLSKLASVPSGGGVSAGPAAASGAAFALLILIACFSGLHKIIYDTLNVHYYLASSLACHSDVHPSIEELEYRVSFLKVLKSLLKFLFNN